MTLRMIMLSPGGEVSSEQVALFLGDGVLVSIQEKPGDCFAPVRERLRLSNGRIRGRGPDYMLYALVDAIIDHYFPVLEALADRLEILEEEVLARPRRELVGQIHLARRELLMLRRAVWPLREAVGRLLQEQTPRIEDDTRLFLRDCYDHVVQLLDMTETMREICSSLLETYMSSVSLRMNETMQVLTVIATIFIPLTFISGLYGMNFDHEISPWNMPELHWRWGYPAVLLLMGLVAVGLLIYFRRIGWLGERASRSVAPDELLETTEV
jgi:magnesium transporter